MSSTARGVIFYGIPFVRGDDMPEKFDDMIEEAEAKFSQVVVRYRGHHSSSEPYVCIKQSIASADWDETVEVRTVLDEENRNYDWDSDCDWDKLLVKFVDYLGFKWSKPKWYLTSDYG